MKEEKFPQIPVDVDEDELAQKYQDSIADQAIVKADSIIHKNRKEIERLKALVEESVFELNFAKYDYAIGKLKKIYLQKPNTVEESKQAFINLVDNVAELIKTNQ